MVGIRVFVGVEYGWGVWEATLQLLVCGDAV